MRAVSRSIGGAVGVEGQGRREGGRRSASGASSAPVSRRRLSSGLRRRRFCGCAMSELRAAGPGPGMTPGGPGAPVTTGPGGTCGPGPVTPLPSPGPSAGKGDAGGGTLGPGGPAPGGVTSAPGGSSSSASGSTSSTSGAAREGWLFKWTNYIKGYQRRWFVLSNGLLSYYR